VTVVIGSKSLRTRTCQKSKLRRPATGAGAGGAWERGQYLLVASTYAL